MAEVVVHTHEEGRPRATKQPARPMDGGLSELAWLVPQFVNFEI